MFCVKNSCWFPLVSLSRAAHASELHSLLKANIYVLFRFISIDSNGCIVFTPVSTPGEHQSVNKNGG